MDENSRNLKKIYQEGTAIPERDLFNIAVAYHIAKEMSCACGLDECLEILVNRIRDLMAVEIVSVMLAERNKPELTIKRAKGLDEEILKKTQVRIGEGIAGWIAKTGKPLLIKDITKDGRFSKRNDKYSTDSLLSVPLRMQEEVLGVINVNNKTSADIFYEDDLDVLNRVADLAVPVIAVNQLQQEAESQDMVRSDVIDNVAHELRTPLAIIKELVGVILDGVIGGINEKQRKFLLSATDNINRLNRLIDELLKTAKAKAKSTYMRRSLIDVNSLIKEVMRSFKPLCEKKEIFVMELLPDKKIEIWADPDQLTQVFTNLMDNAIKYNKPEGRVGVGLEDTERLVKISVHDTGIGIPENDLDRIFDRFSRIEMCTKDNVPRTGIGLSITKDIIQRHGGGISVQSEIGKGCEFIVTLPKDLRG